MRILMLGWELPPHNSGGLGVACYELSKALAGSGAQIDFVLPHPPQPDEPVRDFMTVHHVGSSRMAPVLPALAYSGDYHTVRAVQDDYISFIENDLEVAPDVIHAHDWLTFEAGVAAKRKTGAPLVAHVHATEFDRAGGSTGNPMIHEVELHGLMVADRIVAVSHTTKQLIVDKYHIPADKIEVIHNSIDMNGPVGAPLPEQTMYTYVRAMQQEGYTVVTTIGRLTIQKGLIHFMRAAAAAISRYDRLVFIIAGDGEQKHELIQLSADLGISRHVLFTGFVRGAAWRELYDVSDIFVMNSISEPFGLTALEAAIHDTALLISRTSGVGEVLKNVLRHDYWDVTRLADEMIAVATSRALSQDLREGVKNDFAHISWERAANSCRDQYVRAGALA